MPVVKREAIVPYKPLDMFILVDCIEDYPLFVPGCKRSEVLSRDEDEVKATLHFAHSGFEKSFTTCNRVLKPKMIEVALVEGPFRHLEGFWRFEEQEDQSCKIKLDMEFEFANKLLSLAFGPIFHGVTSRLVDVFVARAHAVYRDGE